MISKKNIFLPKTYITVTYNGAGHNIERCAVVAMIVVSTRCHEYVFNFLFGIPRF
jgi:hypothetical protein